MKNNKALSIVELLVSLVVASILILMIGILSGVGNTGYVKVINTESIYNDISYAFKLMENRVRSSESMTIQTNPSNPPWKSNRLLVKHEKVAGGIATLTQGAFGLYQANGSAAKSLLYVPDTALFDPNDLNTFETILSISSTQILNLTFSDVTANSATVKLDGVKNKIPFAVSNVVLRRSS